MRLPALFLSAFLLLAAPASAGDGQLVLRFKDGRLVPGKVVEVNEKGVRHVSDQGTSFWPWDSITTYGQYEARAAILSEDDGDGRLVLSRWALEAGLPGEARKEILRARGLGAGEASDMDGLLARCDRDQAEKAFAEADRKVAAGDLDGAIAVLRSYLVQAPPSSWTEKGRERAADVVRRREADETRRRLEEEKKRKGAADEKRAVALADLLEDGDDRRTRAGVLALVALREEAGGSFTIFRTSLEKAEQEYLAARRSYDRARRLAGDEKPGPARLALSGRIAVNGRLLDVYLRLARKFVESKNWKEAQEVLDKALRLDPVNAEALDMQDKVKANWRRRKASELTGATGHSSDGTSDR